MSERREKAEGRGVTRLKDSGSLWRGSSLGWTMGVNMCLIGSAGGIDVREGAPTEKERSLEGYVLRGWKVE